MLALTRRLGEEIVIDARGPARINIRVAAINGGQVRLAFQAPQSARIDRAEIAERKQAEEDS